MPGGAEDECPIMPYDDISKRRGGNENLMQNGPGGEEERGQTNEMQRGWHPTGKVLGNVVGGVVGKLRGENLMQNGPGGEEKRQEDPGTGTNMMQNGGEKRETSMMQNAQS